jgi:hypothetical protein
MDVEALMSVINRFQMESPRTAAQGGMTMMRLSRIHKGKNAMSKECNYTEIYEFLEAVDAIKSAEPPNRAALKLTYNHYLENCLEDFIHAVADRRMSQLRNIMDAIEPSEAKVSVRPGAPSDDGIGRAKG